MIIFLLIGFVSLLLGLGYFLNGLRGAFWAFLFALMMWAGLYRYSHHWILRLSRALPLDESQAPDFFRLVRELVEKAHVPPPRIYWMPTLSPNAFTIGMTPQRTILIVTKGLFDQLNEAEMRGVVAHEIAHIKRCDVWVSTMTALFCELPLAVVSFFRWIFYISGGKSQNKNENPLVGIVMICLLPLSALIAHLTVSKSREFRADYEGACLCGNPLYLASALHHIEAGLAQFPMRGVSLSLGHLFIMNPLKAEGFGKLFQTQPLLETRVAQLERLAPVAGV